MPGILLSFMGAHQALNRGDMSAIEELRTTWEALGTADPLWAIMSLPGKRGGRWTVSEFMETGRADAEEILAAAERHSNVPMRSGMEFGCGIGRITQSLAPQLDSIVGVDISGPMLDLARSLNRYGGKVTYVLNTEETLPQFADNSVDLVFSHAVVQHIPKPASIQYIRELVRIARRVAVFQVAEPHWHFGVRPIVRRLTPDRAVHWLRRIIPGRDLHPALFPLRRRDVQTAVVAAGGAVAEAQTLRLAGGWRSVRYVVSKAPS